MANILDRVFPVENSGELLACKACENEVKQVGAHESNYFYACIAEKCERFGRVVARSLCIIKPISFGRQTAE